VRPGLSRDQNPSRGVEAAGALITMSDMRQEPLAGLFSARNRIISLSRAVVIVEAAEKRAALLTATHAADQGRPLRVVPGPVDSDASAGTHALIRKGAILCRGLDDVLEELHGVSGTVQPESATTRLPGSRFEHDDTWLKGRDDSRRGSRAGFVPRLIRSRFGDAQVTANLPS
jgi:predicted Rossmann fold nucleotide-binding protein DprA/Smf involved in DNA uptake